MRAFQNTQRLRPLKNAKTFTPGQEGPWFHITSNYILITILTYLKNILRRFNSEVT